MSTNAAVKLISAANAAVNQTSVPMQIAGQLYYGIQASFSSGTLNGSIRLQGSIDGVEYFDVDGSIKTVSAGLGILYSATASGYLWVRAVYTAGGGTGTITVYGCVKEPTNKY